MPTISRFYGITIQMFFDEKHAPHFHAVYAEYRASIDIATSEIIAGELPNRSRRLVLAWANEHRAELLENWQRARREEPLKDIEPLQ